MATNLIDHFGSYWGGNAVGWTGKKIVFEPPTAPYFFMSRDAYQKYLEHMSKIACPICEMEKTIKVFDATTGQVVFTINSQPRSTNNQVTIEEVKK